METPKLIDVTPFEPLIIKTHYSGFDWKKMEPVCEDLIKTTEIKTHLEDGDAASSAPNTIKQPHMMEEFKPFFDFMKPITEHILFNEWGLFKHHHYIVANSWVNFHAEGGTTLSHHHGATALTLACYLNLPPMGGYIQFLDPLEYQKGFHLKERGEDQWNWRTVRAQTGDVIMFPGWVRHKTESNKNPNEKRWVLTANYMSTFMDKKLYDGVLELGFKDKK
jgi:uncharacterized protein (TIGR02466 family)